MTWRGISTVFGMNGETVTQTLRECRASIISNISNGLGNVLTTMLPVRYNEREHRRHYVTLSGQLLNVIGAVKLAPLNIKNGHYPNLQRFPRAIDILFRKSFPQVSKNFLR